MNKIPTAEEFIQQFAGEFKNKYEGKGGTVKNLMIEFAKLHVKAGLEAASNNLEYTSEDSSVPYVIKESILNAYPESNIK